MRDTIHGIQLSHSLEADIVYSADEGGWYADLYEVPSCKSIGIVPRATGKVLPSAALAIKAARDEAVRLSR